ncbi:MAG TPA: hypothetical protein VN200_10575 [Rhodoglobus sp.]|nr:hypothetical protein [Rhodoglobus sp.]
MQGWAEPARALPLNWGSYPDRYGWGLALIVGGGIHLQGSNTYTLPFLLVGTTALTVGWGIMPASGGRRIAAALLGLLAQWLLLTGPQSMWVLVSLVLAWLIVRHRPWSSYAVLALPLAYGFVAPRLFEEYRWMPVALALGIVIVIGSAWIARAIAASCRPRLSAVSAAIPQRPRG